MRQNKLQHYVTHANAETAYFNIPAHFLAEALHCNKINAAIKSHRIKQTRSLQR